MQKKGSNPTTTILLVNLGTPSSLDIRSIRAYLKEFLNDRRVVDMHPLLWKPLLHGIILRFRPQKTIKAYAKIWDQAADKSPLAVITALQANKLSIVLKDKLPLDNNITVDWAMRYGEPSIDNKIASALQAGSTKLIIVPLYPQYCAATTASVCDKVFDTLKQYRYIPSVTITPPYYNHAGYIKALTEQIQQYLLNTPQKPDKIIASYHGIPARYVKLGDPYYEHCKTSSDLIKQELGLADDYLLTTFQSRFGREEWLQPYTDHVIKDLATNNTKSIAVFSPGFAADCIETLEEIDITYRKLFLQNGGSRFDYIPCLNATENHINFLYDFLEPYIYPKTIDK